MPRAARVTKAGLTVKEDRFVNEYVKHGNGELAYRASYDVAKGRHPQRIMQDAYELLGKPQVRARLSELLNQTGVVAVVSLEECIVRARETYADARKHGDVMGQNNANKLLSQLGGHLIERHQSLRPLGFIPNDELSQRRDALAIEFREDLSRAGFTVEVKGNKAA